jgi:4-amino-4-deoxy-L-arabinose transferase-like glycosyltransferase
LSDPQSTPPSSSTAGEGEDRPPAAPAPAPPPAPRSGPRRFLVLGFLGVFGVLAFWNAGRRDFWSEETGHALVVREMERSRTLEGWLLPALAGEPHLSIPPLSYWLPALAGLGGIEARFAYRLPSLLFALLGLWLTFLLGRRLFDAAVGFAGMTLQASTWLWFASASWLGKELAFAVFCQLAMTGFVLASLGHGERRWRPLGWLGLAGAALTWSLPAAVVLTFIPLTIFSFFRGGVDALKSAFRSAAGRWSLLLFLALAAPWYVYAALRHGPLLVEQHIVQEHLARLLGGAGDRAGPLYYFVVLAAAFLPWSLFLPLAFLHGKDRMGRPGQRLAMVWSLAVIIALTLIPSKHAGSLLLIWPALSLLMAAAFFETEVQYSLWERYLGPGLFRVAPVLLKVPLIATLLLAGAWFAGLQRRLELGSTELAGLLEDRNLVLSLLFILAAAGAACWLTAARVRKLLQAAELPRAAFETACATLFFLFAASFVAPALDALESPRAFLEKEVTPAVQRAPLATYGAKRLPEVSYHLARNVPHLDFPDPLAEAGTPAHEPYRRLVSHLGRRGAYLLLSADDLKNLRAQFPGLTAALEETGVRGRMGRRGEFVLVRSR